MAVSPVRTKGPIEEEDVFGEEELNALIEVAKTKKLRRAETTLEYEKAIADWFGVKHAIAVTSGTTTLTYRAGSVRYWPRRRGDCFPYTFIASDTCVLEQNAIPIFADVEPDYFTLDPEDVERKITKRTKAIIPSHNCRNACRHGSNYGIGEKTQPMGA